MSSDASQSTVRKAVGNPLQAIRYATGRVRHAVAVRRAGSQRAYYENYVDQSFRGDGSPAIGHAGQFEMMGEWQLSMLCDVGLTDDDAMLDIGCGCLRGGRHFVDFLAAGQYLGMDISAEALQAGRDLLREADLLEKRPTLVHNSDLTFAEPELYDRTFDIVLAQSVVTHLDWEQTAQLFEHLPTVLAEDGQFVGTFFLDEQGYSMNHNGLTFRYSQDELRELAFANGLHWERLEVTVPHPNGHELMRVTHR